METKLKTMANWYSAEKSRTYIKPDLITVDHYLCCRLQTLYGSLHSRSLQCKVSLNLLIMFSRTKCASLIGFGLIDS